MRINKTKENYVFVYGIKSFKKSYVSRKELDQDGELRIQVTEALHKITTKLRNQVNEINKESADSIELNPYIQVEKNYDNIYLIYSKIEDKEYIGTTVDVETIRRNPFVGIRLIDLLYLDYARLESALTNYNQTKEPVAKW